MATDMDHHYHHSYCGNEWSQTEVPLEGQQSQVVSISDILDHGSISFGRFAVESLAWEKRSVFSHNRRQEELEKFKAPGFVAQKKAYFEEYYKKVRAMKALQAEQQQTTQPDSCLVAMSTITQVENAVNADFMKEEKKPIIVSERQVLENDATRDILDSSKDATKEELGCCGNDNDKTSLTDETSVSLSAIELQHFVKEASSTSSVSKSSETAQHDCSVSDRAKHDANKQKKQSSSLNAKVTVASAENRTHSNYRITKGAVKLSEKPKVSINDKIAGKKDNGLVSSKRSTPKIAKDISSNNVYSNRQNTEIRPNATVLRTSLVRASSVTSSPISIVSQVKEISTSKGLVDKLPTKLPLHERSTQSTTKEASVTGGLRKKALDNRRSCDGVGRKPLEPSGCQIRANGGVSENQRPKIMSMNLRAQNNVNQNYGVEAERKSNVKGLQKEGDEKSNAGLGKDPKYASSTLFTIHKAPNPKPVPKIASSESADLTHARREPRPKMPSWR